MVSSIPGSHSTSILASLSTRPVSPSESKTSFTDQLAAALEGYLAKSGNGSHLEIDIQPTQSRNSGVRQFIVTVKSPESVPPETASAASASTPASQSPATAQASDAPVSTPVNTPVTNAAPPADLVRAEIDAYWAAQPPEVQALRKVADFGARNVLAQQLADQGFTIDRAIMVWGWDPLKTMATRKMYGYTWVPNINQASISPGPAFTLPGQTPYDPGNPPPGSIAVNTDFANGLGITDPWAL